MLANYRDRTLIRNAVAFEIARQTSQKWVPQGKFADVYLNRKFIGNYYICEKIEVKEKRLNLKENSFLIEFDKYYDGEFKFRTEINDLPVIIKYPKEPDESEIRLRLRFHGDHWRQHDDQLERGFKRICCQDYKQVTGVALIEQLP